jgi:hypothetical protein
VVGIATGSPSSREVLQELLDRKPGVFDERVQQATLHVHVVNRNNDSQSGVLSVLQDVMAAGSVVNKEPRAFERAESVFRLDAG